MPTATCPADVGLARISCTNSKATPAQAIAEPITKRIVVGCLRNSQAKALFGTSSSAKTTATRPDVTWCSAA